VAVSGIRHQEGRNLKKALTLTLTPLSKQVSESNCFFMCGEAFIDGGTMTLAGPTGRNGWRPSRKDNWGQALHFTHVNSIGWSGLLTFLLVQIVRPDSEIARV
jgi:hypothetical protein